MAGVNSLAESDRHPLWLCPECLAKLSWATGSSPGEHLRRVRALFLSLEFKNTAARIEASLAALGEPFDG